MQQAEVFVEALISRQQRFLKTKVPLADAGCSVAILLEQLGDGQLIGMDTIRRIRAVHPDVVADATRVAAGQQASTRGATDRRRGVVVGKPRALRRHRVDVRGIDLGRAVAAQVIVALVVDEDENDVRLRRYGSLGLT